MLAEAGRVEVTENLRAVSLLGTSAPKEFPSRLIVEFSIALICPVILEPFMYKTKSTISQVEGGSEVFHLLYFLRF